MTIYYLYVKTHLKTNQKYLGYTKQNPFVYKGSGKLWTRHIKKHGNQVWTNIIFQTELKEEIIEKGIYYSKLWNIIDSSEWKNLKEETGDGGFNFTKEYLSKKSKKMWESPGFREDLIIKLKESSKRIDVIEKRRISKKIYYSDLNNRKENAERQKIAQNKLEVKEKKSKSQSLVWEKNYDNMMKIRNTDEYKSKIPLIIKEIHNRPEIKESKSIKMKDNWNDPDFLKRNTFYCEICNKKIKGKGQWSKHLNSKEHVKNNIVLDDVFN